MCPRLTMDMVITHNLTPTDITLDMDMVRGLLKLSQDMVMAMLPATPIEAHRDSMDTMVVMDMVMVMVRGLLMLDMVMAMLPATPTGAHRDSMDTMVVMDMVMVMVRGLLMLDMVMVSTTTARGQLMLDILVMEVMEVMEWLAATSKLTGHTLPMVSVLPTLTK